MVSAWQSSPEAVELSRMAADNGAALGAVIDEAAQAVVDLVKASKSDLSKVVATGKRYSKNLTGQNEFDLEGAVGPALAEALGQVQEQTIRLDMAKDSILGISDEASKKAAATAAVPDLRASSVGRIEGSDAGRVDSIELAGRARSPLRPMPTGASATAQVEADSRVTAPLLISAGGPDGLGGVGGAGEPAITISADAGPACLPSECFRLTFMFIPFADGWATLPGDQVTQGGHNVYTVVCGQLFGPGDAGAGFNTNPCVMHYAALGHVLNVEKICGPCLTLESAEGAGAGGQPTGGGGIGGGAAGGQTCDTSVTRFEGSAGQPLVTFICDQQPPAGAGCTSAQLPDGTWRVTCPDQPGAVLETMWALSQCGPFRLCGPAIGVAPPGDGGGAGGPGGAGGCCPKCGNNVCNCPPPEIKVVNQNTCPAPVVKIENKIIVPGGEPGGGGEPAEPAEPIEPCKFEIDTEVPGVFWFDDCYLELRERSMSYFGLPAFIGPAPLDVLAAERMATIEPAPLQTFIGA